MQSDVAELRRDVDLEVAERSSNLGSGSIASGPFFALSILPAGTPLARSPFLIRLLQIFRRYLNVESHTPPHDVDDPPPLTVIEQLNAVDAALKHVTLGGPA